MEIFVPPTYERAALISLISNHKCDLIRSGRIFVDLFNLSCAFGSVYLNYRADGSVIRHINSLNRLVGVNDRLRRIALERGEDIVYLAVHIGRVRVERAAKLCGAIDHRVSAVLAKDLDRGRVGACVEVSREYRGLSLTAHKLHQLHSTEKTRHLALVVKVGIDKPEGRAAASRFNRIARSSSVSRYSISSRSP